MEKYREVIDSAIVTFLEERISDPLFREVCLYASSGGKRVRSVITCSLYKCKTGKIDGKILSASIAIELIHCASLILDDMMDSDRIRRGRESVFAKYGDTIAQLGAAQLVSLSFLSMTDCFNQLPRETSNREIPLLILNALSKNLFDLNLGQYQDTVTFGSNLSVDCKQVERDPEDLIHKKTSSLFEPCFIWSWVLSHSEHSTERLTEENEKMKGMARSFGLLFQIADDFEDIDQDRERRGKNYSMNYCLCYGVDCARNKYDETRKKFFADMEANGLLTDEISEIVNALSEKIERSSTRSQTSESSGDLDPRKMSIWVKT